MNYEKWLPELTACPIFDDLSGGEIKAVLSRRFFVLRDITENIALFLCDQLKAQAKDPSKAPAAEGFIPDRDPEELAEMMMIAEGQIEAAYQALAERKLIRIDGAGGIGADTVVTVLDKAGLEAAAGPRLHIKMGH